MSAPPTPPGPRACADPREVLRSVWGYPAFRGPQEAIVRHVIGGGSALVLMPTGGGKSLCYQVPALCRPGLAVVVSPLIALMDDQVEGLQQLGVRAGALHSGLEAGRSVGLWQRLGRGELDLLYVSPERLLGGDLLERLAALPGPEPLALFAIDEAHCVSQWGHDFRPEYIQLGTLAERFPEVPRLALTATADPRTRDEIRQRLRLESGQVFLASFDRPNIRYLLRAKEQPGRQLLAFLAEHRDQAGIVY
ncbi:MAG: RecQ family ATP-dependent DNA helicase, partial [Synechococcaceae cyanobacterium]|nr:RecQ family ATP-dependent DNA helicase [Synechococcaceae cyanobacterium]